MSVQWNRNQTHFTRTRVVLLAVVVTILMVGHGCNSAQDERTAQVQDKNLPQDVLPGDNADNGNKGRLTDPGKTTNSQPDKDTTPNANNGNPQPQDPKPTTSDTGVKPLSLPVGNYDGPLFGKGGTLILADEITFMGSKAKGNRVCIIADKSNSMKAPFVKGAKKVAKDGRAIDFLKVELHKTLKSLRPEQDFFIIFFDATPEPMPDNRWLKGSEADKVVPWINNVTMNLGTKPLPAFKIAFKLDPKPDVIFFMTDGEFKNILPDLDKLNKDTPKVVINTIQLQAARKLGEPGVVQLQELAKRAGGTFTLINAATVGK